jgi:hypothetical protein
LYYHARYYDPLIAKFLSPDSIVPDATETVVGIDSDVAFAPLTVDFHEPEFVGTLSEEHAALQQDGFFEREQRATGPANPQALNRYAYVLNNPLRYMDPTGHKPRPQPGPPPLAPYSNADKLLRTKGIFYGSGRLPTMNGPRGKVWYTTNSRGEVMNYGVYNSRGSLRYRWDRTANGGEIHWYKERIANGKVRSVTRLNTAQHSYGARAGQNPKNFRGPAGTTTPRNPSRVSPPQAPRRTPRVGRPPRFGGGGGGGLGGGGGGIWNSLE